MWITVEHESQRQRVAVVQTQEGMWVGWRGVTTFIHKHREFAAEGVSDDSIRAPMTGKVVQVKVAVGERVEADALLVILEAMKMEYRLTAPRAGVVEAVSCKAGELVDLGATLVVLQHDTADATIER